MLPTSLRPPMLRAAVLPRPRLLDLIDEGVQHTLTLIGAPAGMGKTVLAHDWERSGRAPGPVAWVTLTPSDDERACFWRLVVAALDGVGVLDGVPDLALAASVEVDDVMPTLIEALGRRTEPVVLVIDDLQEVSDPEILADFERLLRVTPPCLRLVVTTRVEPRVRLQRLRLAGQVTTLDAGSLAFTREETEEIVRARGLTLSDEDLLVLWRRTEGWPAAVVLAARALEGHANPSAFIAVLAGTEGPLADYLMEELMTRLPPEVADFLTQTALVERISGDLANAITGGHGGGATLEDAAKQGLLVTALDDRRAWYRYHRLLRGFLSDRLRRQSPALVPVVHTRASRWFAEHGHDLETIRHAMLAEDWAAVRLLVMSRWLTLTTRGELRELSQLLTSGLPPPMRREPGIVVPLAVHQLQLGNVQEADVLMDVARASADPSPTFRLGRAAAELARFRIVGDLEHAEQAIAEGQTIQIEDLEAETPGAGTIYLDVCAWAKIELGVVELWTDDLDAAEEHLLLGISQAEEADVGYLVHVGLAYLAFVQLLRGDLDAASATVAQSVAISEELGVQHSAGEGTAVSVLGHCALLRGQIEEAAHHLDEARRLTARSHDVPLRAYAKLQLGRMAMVQGEPSDGLVLVTAAQRLVTGTAFAPLLDPMLAAIQAHGLVLTGHAEQADAIAATARAGDEAEWVTIVAQHELRHGRAATAAAVLEEWHASGQRARHNSFRLLALILRAQTAALTADVATGRATLEDALACAAGTGVRLPFLEAPGDVAGLLASYPPDGAHAALADALQRAIEEGAAPERSPHLPEPLDQLSDREMGVVRLLPTRLSNREIADELDVSVNTVKTHLKQIYRKLSVHDRREAVVRARQLGLLTSGRAGSSVR